MNSDFLIVKLILLFYFATTAPAQVIAKECSTFPLQIEKIKTAAENGDGYCQAVLGGLYWRGLGIKKDIERSHHWSEKSWKQGHPLGQYNLGYFLDGRHTVKKDPTTQKKVYAKAKSGFESLTSLDPHSGFSLGIIIYYGFDGSKEDKKSGCTLFSSSAKQSHPLAQSTYGDCLKNGILGAKNLPEARDWYQKSALGGYPGSAWSLGYLYETQNEIASAIKYYTQAADMQDPIYMLRWGRMLEAGVFKDPFKPDKSTALKYYEKAAEYGSTKGYYLAAWLYWSGAGDIEKNEVKAKEYFLIAAKTGDINSINFIKAMGWQLP